MLPDKEWEKELDEENNEVMKNYEDSNDNNNMDKPGYHHLRNEGMPTQTHGLVTTVPQNIANVKIGDKHTPTRNSLRHSRMIVMNKAGKFPTEYLPPIVKYHDRAKAVMWIILIIGIIMSFECSSLQIYAANTKPHLNPVYTTIPILLSGIFGFIHLSCCRKEYPGLRRNACEKSIKILSISTSLLAAVTGFIYFFNGILHLVSFFYLDCAPPDILNNICICRLSDVDMESSILNNSWDYIDLSCFEVYHVFNVIIGVTGFTCLIIALMEIFYLNLHWDSRSSREPVKNYNFI